MRPHDLRTPRGTRYLVAGAAVAVAALLVLVAAQLPLDAAKPPASGGGAAAKCVDPSISVTILPLKVPDSSGAIIDISALSGDSKGNTYVNGVDKVFNGVIHACPAFNGVPGSNDATLGVNGSNRSITFSFANVLKAVKPPTWTSTTFLAKPFMNIRKILWGRLNGYTTFTTRMGFSFIKGAGDRGSYNLRFMAQATNTPNAPNMLYGRGLDATVTVQDLGRGSCPTTDPAAPKDAWIVTIDDPYYEGTLYNEKDYSIAGHYAMPFSLRIDALTCLPD